MAALAFLGRVFTTFGRAVTSLKRLRPISIARHIYDTGITAMPIAALIAFLLLRMAQTCQQAITTALTFTRLIRANLLHKRPIDRLLDPSPPPSHNPDQLALAFL